MAKILSGKELINVIWVNVFSFSYKMTPCVNPKCI